MAILRERGNGCTEGNGGHGYTEGMEGQSYIEGKGEMIILREKLTWLY